MSTILLIKEAIAALKERSGSSTIAINKYLESEKKMVPKKHVMKAALKHGVETGVLVQVKNSYKLSADAKKKPMAIKKAEVTAKPKKATTVKKSLVKKTAKDAKPKTAQKKVAAKPKKTTSTKKALPKKAGATKAKKTISLKKKASPKTKKVSMKKTTKVAAASTKKPKQ